MRKNVNLLIVSTLMCWALVAYPARLLWGESALLFSATAAALCLVPAAMSLLWLQNGLKGDANQQLLAVLGGMGLRVVVVVGVGMILYHSVAEFYYQRFWVWVIFFYLFTLALEMMLLAQQLAAEKVQKS